MKRTKSKKNYIIRLGIFSLISQIPYILMIKGMPVGISDITEFEKITRIFNHFTSLFNVGFTLEGKVWNDKYINTYTSISIYIRNIWI